MQDQIVVTGIVIKQSPVGESDRRVTILTTQRGKISAFARGARKPNSRFAATTCPFCFGEFKLYGGRDSYNIAEAEIKNFFESFLTDIEGACFAAYFGEIIDYYCRENNDEKDMLKLFYQSLRAIEHVGFENSFVRTVFELKSIVINGEYPGAPNDIQLSEAALYALEFIRLTPPEKLYTFKVADTVAEELRLVAARYCKRYMDHNFKSLDILEQMTGC